MDSGLAELLRGLRAASTAAECLGTLIASRELAGCRIVGYREERHQPAVTRLPRPAWWAEKMGWPRGFVQEWIRLNYGQIDPSLGGAALRPGRIARWELRGPAGAGTARGRPSNRRPAIDFLLRHESAAVSLLQFGADQAPSATPSWLVPAREDRPPTAATSRSLLLFAEGSRPWIACDRQTRCCCCQRTSGAAWRGRRTAARTRRSPVRSIGRWTPFAFT